MLAATLALWTTDRDWLTVLYEFMAYAARDERLAAESSDGTATRTDR